MLDCAGRHCVSTKERHEIVKTYNLIKRMEEEKNLLLIEMRHYINYFKVVIPSQLRSQINSKGGRRYM